MSKIQDALEDARDIAYFVIYARKGQDLDWRDGPVEETGYYTNFCVPGCCRPRGPFSLEEATAISWDYVQKCRNQVFSPEEEEELVRALEAEGAWQEPQLPESLTPRNMIEWDETDDGAGAGDETMHPDAMKRNEDGPNE